MLTSLSTPPGSRARGRGRRPKPFQPGMIGGETRRRWKSTGPAPRCRRPWACPPPRRAPRGRLERGGEHRLRAVTDVGGGCGWRARSAGRRSPRPTARGADGDADEPDVGGQVDERRAPAAAGGRRSDLQARPSPTAGHLGGDGGPGDLEASASWACEAVLVASSARNCPAWGSRPDPPGNEAVVILAQDAVARRVGAVACAGLPSRRLFAHTPRPDALARGPAV